eukprot:SAG31_NODE_4026_length_3653_cov_19.795442_3_plen_42_part_00
MLSVDSTDYNKLQKLTWWKEKLHSDIGRSLGPIESAKNVRS